MSVYSSPSKYSVGGRSTSPNRSISDRHTSFTQDRKSLHDARALENLNVEKDLFERRCKELTQTNQGTLLVLSRFALLS